MLLQMSGLPLPFAHLSFKLGCDLPVVLKNLRVRYVTDGLGVPDIKCSQSSWLRFSVRVDLAGRHKRDAAAIDLNFPALPVNVVVTSRTKHDAVVDVRFAAMSPIFDVVRLAVLGWGVTFGATAVTFEQRDALPPLKYAFLAT